MQATIKQVAQRAGVSTATVSYVLNGTGTVTAETRQRVLDAVAELHYQPRHAARSLRGRSRTLGMTLPAAPGRLADPVMAEVVAGVTDAAALRGYYLLLAPVADAQPEPELCLSLARTGRVDGIILLDMQVEDERALALAAAGVPHVCAGPPPAGSGSPSVSTDDRAGALAAAQHLLALGHRRVGLIQLPSELAESEPRYQGYAEGLAAAGIEVDPQLVVEAGRSEEDGYQAMSELLSASEPPTAVLASSDDLAFGAMHALYDAGLVVGQDVSLVGFDDTPLAAHSHPPLTALRQPRRAMGEQLAALLDDAIQGRGVPPRQVTLSAKLMVRRSSGPPRRSTDGTKE